MDMKHHECHDHEGHDHASMMSGPKAAADFLRRFIASTVMLVLLVLLTPTAHQLLNIPVFNYEKFIKFGLATVIFIIGSVFFKHAGHEIKAKKYGMMTLVSIAVLAGYLFSAVATFLPSLNVEFYVEISTLIWVLLFGHYLEARSGSAAGDALAEVSKLLPHHAYLMKGGEVSEVTVADLKVGDIVRVRAGEKVPSDGEITKGAGSFNEAHISGEAKAIDKSVGMTVVAGAILEDGSVEVKLTKVGENSTIGQIKKLVEQAGHTKPTAQRMADVWAGRLTIIALSVAILAFLYWFLVAGETLVFALTIAITVLVIACPHALGLAIPTVSTISTRLAVKKGLFIKDLSSLERAAKVDYVLFDKTGTLTSGEFAVNKVVATAGVKADVILQKVAAIEEHSTHVIGKAIVKYARAKKIKIVSATDIKVVNGQGISGKIGAQRYLVGSAKFMINQKLHPQINNNEETVIYLSDGKSILGEVMLADAIKPESKNVVAKLHEQGIKVMMLTGDNESVAKKVAVQLKIDNYAANVNPQDKYASIKKIQAEGKTVLMVGDGVNDAPALKQADVGVAVGNGTDVAVEAGDVVLTKSNPESVVKYIDLAQASVSKMKQNLWWALGYNIVAIPSAAGVFIPWGFQLRPEAGAIVMSLSTVIVVANTLTMLRGNLNSN